MEKHYVYICTNPRHTVLYVGSTQDLTERMKRHSSGHGAAFTAKYNISKLVYFGSYPSRKDAMQREFQIKKYRREKKESLINELNPDWKDLLEKIVDQRDLSPRLRRDSR